MFNDQLVIRLNNLFIKPKWARSIFILELSGQVQQSVVYNVVGDGWVLVVEREGRLTTHYN